MRSMEPMRFKRPQVRLLSPRHAVSNLKYARFDDRHMVSPIVIQEKGFIHPRRIILCLFHLASAYRTHIIRLFAGSPAHRTNKLICVKKMCLLRPIRCFHFGFSAPSFMSYYTEILSDKPDTIIPQVIRSIGWMTWGILNLHIHSCCYRKHCLLKNDRVYVICSGSRRDRRRPSDLPGTGFPGSLSVRLR